MSIINRIQNGCVFLLTLAGLGLWIYTGLHPHDVAPYLRSGAYYAMFTLFFAWVYAAVKDLQARQFAVGSFLQRYYGGLIFCLFMTLLIYFSVKPSFKTLADETNLLSTSHAMVFGKTCVNELMGIRSFGNFDALATAIDPRPFLFPFLTSLLHTARGYDPANAFLLNGLLMFVFLSAVFICTRQFFNERTSCAAVILVASSPIFSICGTSGGFDLLACFCFGLSLITLFSYLRSPSGENFALLWTTLLMFANTRYESFIFFFVIMGMLVVSRRVNGAFIKANCVLMAMTPLWFLIITWSRLANSDFIQDPETKHLFAVSSFRANLLDLLKSQLDFHFQLPYNNVLNLITFALFIYLFAVIVVKRKAFQKPDQRRLMPILSVCMGIYLTIVLSHYAGAYTSRTNARYYLPFSVICAVMPLFWLATLSEETRRVLATPFLLGSIALFALYHPIAVEGRFINRLGPNLEIYFSHAFLKDRFPEKRVLVIAEWPTEYTALEYGAMSFFTANAAAPRVLSGLQRHLYQEIIVVQKIAFATQAPAPEQALIPAYPLETLSEYETYDDGFIRISRVKLSSHPGGGG